ncbi:MAG TPA: hypothetical protein VN671_06575 [Solirubrobacterales bacterium]|nr:hypothetical protein [Solirubrobacterales bacterium]
MRFSELAEGGVRRRMALAGLALAAMLTMAIGTAALRPAEAHATAVKDNCTLMVTNNTGSQGNVRPILYTPLLPTSPASLALYVARAATGIQTGGSFDVFTNYGLIVPSWGCHTFMNFSSPSGTVSCKVEAPSRGANTFDCDGPAATKIIDNNDDISGQVGITSLSGKPSSAAPQQPDVSGGSVRLGALPNGGWKKSMDITDFGIAGKLLAEGTEAAGCGKTGKEASPSDVNTEEVVRGGGAEGVGAVVTTYANAGQAADFVKEMTSDHGIGCMAKLLNDQDTKVTATPLPTEAEGVEGAQLVISRKGDDGWHPVSYFNVSGWTDGNEAAVEWYETVGAAPSEADEAEAAQAVRIG